MRPALRHPCTVLVALSVAFCIFVWVILVGIHGFTERFGPPSRLTAAPDFSFGDASNGHRVKANDWCHSQFGSCIVYTNLGDSFEFQQYIWRSINQSRFFNPCTSIYLISSAAAFNDSGVQQQLQKMNVKAIDYSSLSHPVLKAFRSAFFVQGDMRPDGNENFNQYTSERMLAVYSLMHSKNLSKVVHLENDNLIYFPIESVVSAMDTCEARLAIPFVSTRLAVIGIAYIAAADDLLPFIEFMIKVFAMSPQAAIAYVGSEWLNDMTLLGKFFFDQSSTLSVTELPTKLYQHRNVSSVATAQGNNSFLSPVVYREGHPHSCIAEALPNSIFDSCVLGQYFGGTWAVPGVSHWQDHRQFDPRNQTLWWKETYFNQHRIRIPFINETRVLSFHVHSKRLEEFASF